MTRLLTPALLVLTLLIPIASLAQGPFPPFPFPPGLWPGVVIPTPRPVPSAPPEALPATVRLVDANGKPIGAVVGITPNGSVTVAVTVTGRGALLTAAAAYLRARPWGAGRAGWAPTAAL